jgi:hypothetical protein
VSGRTDVTPPIQIDLDDWPHERPARTLVRNGHMFVIEELIVNAFKYGAPGSDVSVRCWLNEDSQTIRMLVTNEIASHHLPRAPRKYSGTELVRSACAQCGWMLKVNVKRSETKKEKWFHEVLVEMPLFESQMNPSIEHADTLPG